MSWVCAQTFNCDLYETRANVFEAQIHGSVCAWCRATGVSIDSAFN